LRQAGRGEVREAFLDLTRERVPLRWVRNARARRYVLRLQRDGVLRLTIPRGGTVEGGQRFVREQSGWVERALARWRARPVAPREWRLGMGVLLRGEMRVLALAGEGMGVWLGVERVAAGEGTGDLRPVVEGHLRALAERELPPRVLALAAGHDLVVRRVSVRAQRSRWGSCSRRGTISLNWRLIQAPESVRDYVILHELMHLREMNHSPRYWAEVARVCPGYREAEAWLRAHAELLR
jgi:predicted metal-dependent hydrolase